MYVCPLCVHAFPRAAVEAGILTAEHVPARSLGGRPLLLTCWQCNSKRGHKLDAQARRAENIVAVMKGEMEQQHRVRLTINNLDIQAAIQSSPGAFQLFGLPKRTNPADFARFFAELERLVATGNTDWSIRMGFPRDVHSRQQARVAWLRYAYLIAVAALGYRYALRPAWEMIRQQLREPDAVLVDRFSVTDPSASPSAQQIFLIDEPAYLRSLAVRMGRHVVLLPRETDATLYERLKTRPQQLNERFTGREIPWPKVPAFALDFHVASSLGF
jgi:hypothetical protein